MLSWTSISGPTKTMPCKPTLPASTGESTGREWLLLFQDTRISCRRFRPYFFWPLRFQSPFGTTRIWESPRSATGNREHQREEREEKTHECIELKWLVVQEDALIKIRFFHFKYIQTCGDDPSWLTRWSVSLHLTARPPHKTGGSRWSFTWRCPTTGGTPKRIVYSWKSYWHW